MAGQTSSVLFIPEFPFPIVLSFGFGLIALVILVQFIEYIQACPRAGDDWIQGFVNFYTRKGLDEELCKGCVDKCVERLIDTMGTGEG